MKFLGNPIITACFPVEFHAINMTEPIRAPRTNIHIKVQTSTENSKKSIWQEFAFMMQEKGISELYRGLYLRAVNCVFSDLIYYGTFSMLQNRKEGRTPFENGTLAGIITNVLTIPVDTVSTNLQILESENRTGTVEVTENIQRTWNLKILARFGTGVCVDAQSCH